MRYLPLTDEDRKSMLSDIGVKSIEALFQGVPREAYRNSLLDLPLHQSEQSVETFMTALSDKTLSASEASFFCGAGAYKHHIPASVDHLIQRSEFLTSYTPYQPEIAQGTLQYLFEFQTQVAQLTGMEIANSSMYDGSTAAAEAVLMAQRITKRNKAVVSGNLHAHYQQVISTLSKAGKFEVKQAESHYKHEEDLLSLVDEETSCVVVQNPDIFGRVRDLSNLAQKVQEKGALLIVVITEIVSLGVLKTPASMGADIVVAEGQSIGNGLNFGGPYLGLFATRQKYIRQMPGRLCGETVDEDGKRGFVLTLSTREQHIRREKATSNICTNSGLCALAFTIHMSLLGGTGLQKLAQLNHAKAVQCAQLLSKIKNVNVLTEFFFNEFTISLPQPAAEIVERLAEKNILAGVPVSRLFPKQGFDNLLIVAVTEMNDEQDMKLFHDALQEQLS